MLCREFADSTILTIAHRLRTIIDYDRVSHVYYDMYIPLIIPKIMLLEQGKIVEFDRYVVLSRYFHPSDRRSLLLVQGYYWVILNQDFMLCAKLPGRVNLLHCES
jgi:hypothetical protein